MKKKTVGLLLALMTAVSLIACGTENEITEVVAVEVTEETGLIVEELPIELAAFEALETEEPVYIDYEDLYLADNYLKLGKEKLEAVDMDSFEKTYEDYVLSESVDLYNFEGTWMGYSKPDIKVILFGTNDKWAEVSFAKTILYIPKERFNMIASNEVRESETEDVLLVKADEAISKQEATMKPEIETPASVTSGPVVAEPVITEPVVTEPETHVVDNTKYTPEQAIAVYRSIMEANGISWDPSLKNGGSWGTGWIYLAQGQPELAGNNSVESYRMGDSVGHSWNAYYLEVTGSDENAVYITKWHN